MSSVGRLTFLYPQLARAARAACPREARRAPAAAGWTRQKSSFAPRHGTAVDLTTQKKLDQVAQSQQPVTPELETSATDVDVTKVDEPTVASEDAKATAQAAKEEPSEAPSPARQDESKPSEDTASASDRLEDGAKSTMEQARQSGPLDAVLHMPSPEVVAKQHPALSPSPYVHHFDSYSFVKQLQEGGYSVEQAITAMKGIRGLLALNLDKAQDSLVSKSDVENETYLFRAACSELSTEIKNNRRLQDEQMRQQRTHLQHEVDNLTQSLNQESLTLNDNVRGMFNDRKMAVREEQKSVESAVQQISYKISIMLSSDSKSEIEGVRWILIRRSVLGILFMAVLTLGTLRYATYVTHERQKEEDRLQREEEEDRRSGGRRGEGSMADVAMIASG